MFLIFSIAISMQKSCGDDKRCIDKSFQNNHEVTLKHLISISGYVYPVYIYGDKTSFCRKEKTEKNC